MKKFGILVVLVTAALLSRPAMGQQRFTTTVEAPLQTWPSVAGVWVSPAALGQSSAQAQAAPLAVAVQAAGQADAKPLPARVELAEGAYRVLWQVPPAAKGQTRGQPQAFTLTLGADHPSPRLAAKEANLLYNGDFEQTTANGLPTAIGLSAASFQKQFRLEQEAGNRFLSFNTPEQGRHGPIYLTPPVSVQPKRGYVCSFRYRITGAQAESDNFLTFTSVIQFKDAAGKALPFARALTTKDLKTDGWRNYELRVTAPAQAMTAQWSLRNRSKVAYSIAVDDLRIAPLALAEVKNVRTAQGKEISLAATSPNIRRFDLGPKGSPLWAGFTALTPDDKYDAKKGYGFTRLTRPRALDTTRPEALGRDFISSLDARLRVDLPDGSYRLWLLTGDSLVSSTVARFYFASQVTLNGKEVFKTDQTPVAFFDKGGAFWRFYNTFWTPGMDYYDAFVAPHFQTHAFQTDVTKGRLEINWRNLPVNAILIAPADQTEPMERELAALADQRRRATQITETPDPTEAGVPPTAAEAHRGFVLFRRPANETIYPSSRPQAGEQIAELKTFAAPGQAQSVRFSLLPLKDLGAVSVRAGELKSDSGTIPASAVEIRVERYTFLEAGRVKRALPPDYRYQIAPFALDHRDSVPGNQGVTWSWWATLRIPQGTPAGIYEGQLAIQSEHGEAFNLPLRLRVLPFELKPLPIAQGYYYFPAEPWYSTFWGGNVNGPSYEHDPAVRKLIARNEERELAFMKDLGLNSVAFGDDLRGDIEYADGALRLKKDNRLAFWMDIYARAGMGPMPYYGFISWGSRTFLSRQFDALKETYGAAWKKAYRNFPNYVRQIGRKQGWPQILWYLSDEASNDGEEGGKRALMLAETMEGQPDIRTIASLNGKWEHSMPAHLAISMPNIAFPITEETIAMIHKGGSQLWIYNCGSDRLMLGLYPWRIDAKGRFQWTYRSNVGNPWDDLDASYGESAYSISLPGPDGPVGTLRSEAVRDAITDHRYIVTLESAIAAAKGKADKQEALARAQQFLQDLRRRVPVDARTLVGYKVDPRETGEAVGGEFKNTDALDRVRWAAAHFILELQ